MTKYLGRFSALLAISVALLSLISCGGGGSSSSQSNTPSSGTSTPITLPTLSPSTTGSIGTSYSFASPAIAGGTAPYTVSVSTGALPTGLTIAIATGNAITITGTPTATGTFNFTLQVKDASSPQQNVTSAQLTITILAPSIVLPALAPPDAAQGQAFTYTSGSITGGVAPFTASIVSGALPSGLAVSLSTGNTIRISGTPTTLGTFSFIIQIKDSFSPQQLATTTLITMRVVDLKIGTMFVPNAVAGQGYGFNLARLGGVAPFTWSLSSGSLPAGLVLSATTGLISGTPATAGAGVFTVKLADSSGASTAANLVINVLPELPRSVVDTTVPTPGAGSPIFLPGGLGAVSTLQLVINTAPCGAIVQLHAGDSWIGNVTFPRRNPECTSSTPITITTDDPSLPTAGNRVTPADAVRMPKILTSTAGIPALDFSSQGASAGGSFYRIVGVEIGVTGAAATSAFNAPLVKMGSDETSVAVMPHDIFIDRCYIHGTSASEVKQGVLMNGVKLAVIDSNISDIHQTASDSQAITGWNGPGPYKIQNNRLEAAGESILFGGTVPANTDNTSKDILIQNNYLFKPLTWQTASWLIKDHLELKNAQRVLVQGNILENNWNNTQPGFSVLLTPSGPTSLQGGPSTTVSDITFANNEVLHVGGGVSMSAVDTTDPLVRGKNIALLNNVLLDSNNLPLSQTPFGANGKGYAVQISDGVPNVTMDHNSGLATQAIIFADNPSSTTRTTGLLMRHNLFSRTNFGIFCNGLGEGSAALNFCTVPPAPEFFSFNVLIGASSSVYPATNNQCSVSGATCYPFDQTAAGIVDPNNCDAGTFDFLKCGVQGLSPYSAAGLDGADIGANTSLVAKPLAPSVNAVKP